MSIAVFKKANGKYNKPKIFLLTAIMIHMWKSCKKCFTCFPCRIMHHMLGMLHRFDMLPMLLMLCKGFLNLVNMLQALIIFHICICKVFVCVSFRQCVLPKQEDEVSKTYQSDSANRIYKIRDLKNVTILKRSLIYLIQVF